MIATFQHISTFQCSVEDLFQFHEQKQGFETLINIDNSVEVIQAPESIAKIGTEAILKITLAPGIKTKWIARHTEYKKNEIFVDEQISGPFKFFRHEHKFSKKGIYAELNDSIEFEFYFNFISKYFVAEKLKAQFLARHSATASSLNTEFKNTFSGLK